MTNSIEEFIKAYKGIPFHSMLLDINEYTEFRIDGHDIQWDRLTGDEYNYSGIITEGLQRKDGWVVVNVDCSVGTWVTMFFKEENEVKNDT